MGDKYMNQVGKKIKESREKLNLSMTKLAELTGLTISAISQFENEKDDRAPSLDSLQKLANALGVTTDYLLGREEEISDSSIKAMFRGAQEMNESDKENLIQFYQFLKSRKDFKDQKNKKEKKP